MDRDLDRHRPRADPRAHGGRDAPGSAWRPSSTSCVASSWARTACSTASSSSLLARGHVLLEGVPGLAKTLTARDRRPRLRRPVQPHPVHAGPRARPTSSAARCSTAQGGFGTRLGPVFANFVLADEINRAPAKVQSALLEVMAEGHATIAGETPPGAAPVLRARHPEPDRERGRLPAARGPGRPLRDEAHRAATRRWPTRRRSCAAWPPTRPSRAHCSTPSRSVELQETADTVFVRPPRARLRRAPGQRHPQPRGRGPRAPRSPTSTSAARPRASLALIRGGRALAVIRGRTYVHARGRAQPLPRRARATAWCSPTRRSPPTCSRTRCSTRSSTPSRSPTWSWAVAGRSASRLRHSSGGSSSASRAGSTACSRGSVRADGPGPAASRRSRAPTRTATTCAGSTGP